MTRIVLRIDRLVVEGTTLTPRDAETLRRGLEVELGVQLRRQSAGSARYGGVAPAMVGTHRAAEISLVGAAGAIGQAAARSVAGALGSFLGSGSTAASADMRARLPEGDPAVDVSRPFRQMNLDRTGYNLKRSRSGGRRDG